MVIHTEEQYWKFQSGTRMIFGSLDEYVAQNDRLSSGNRHNGLEQSGRMTERPVSSDQASLGSSTIIIKTNLVLQFNKIVKSFLCMRAVFVALHILDRSFYLRRKFCGNYTTSLLISSNLPPEIFNHCFVLNLSSLKSPF